MRRAGSLVKIGRFRRLKFELVTESSQLPSWPSSGIPPWSYSGFSMPSTRALRKSPRKSPSPKRVVAEAITPPRGSPAKRKRSKSPNGSSRKDPRRLRFSQEGQDDSQDESQQEISTKPASVGVGCVVVSWKGVVFHPLEPSRDGC